MTKKKKKENKEIILLLVCRSHLKQSFETFLPINMQHKTTTIRSTSIYAWRMLIK